MRALQGIYLVGHMYICAHEKDPSACAGRRLGGGQKQPNSCFPRGDILAGSCINLYMCTHIRPRSLYRSICIHVGGRTALPQVLRKANACRVMVG